MDGKQIKIVHRFLKESGLFGQWKEYVNILGRKKYIYSQESLTSVFGCCNFTAFLHRRIYFKGFISSHFRNYLFLTGIGEKYNIEPEYLPPPDSYIYNFDTGEYKIKILRVK